MCFSEGHWFDFLTNYALKLLKQFAQSLVEGWNSQGTGKYLNVEDRSALANVLYILVWETVGAE